MSKQFLNILCFTFLINLINALEEYGILAAESSTEKENFCIIHYKEFASSPEDKSKADFYPIQNASDTNFCDYPMVPESDEFRNKILLAFKHNCSISEQASNAQEQGGKAILFITHSGRVAPVSINATIAKNINISVGLISENSFERLKKMGYPVTGRLFVPNRLHFDFSLLIIWVIAMFTITGGSYWSGRVRFALYQREISVLPTGTESGVVNHPRPKSKSSEASSINVHAYCIACIVLGMVVMLLLLYFFLDYLVYVIIAMFVLASMLSVYGFGILFIYKTPATCTICNKDIRKIFLAIFSIGISIWWLIIRNQKYGWILQDVLGIVFCMSMISSIRLASLKNCTVLLVLLFFYDIFFVFVTPYMTKKGESIMEHVAAGGTSEERLPMLIRVAHFGFDGLSICYQQYSVLGFGDILVPGLLTSYCYGFDLITNKKMLYFLTTITTYGIGLLATFGGLFLMNMAQPALLYLVPFTLIPPIIISCFQGEFNLMWNGVKPIKITETNKYPDVKVTSTTGPAAEISEEIPAFVHNDIQSISKNIVDGLGERKHLLK